MKIKSWILILGFLLLSLFLVACSDDGDKNEAVTESESELGNESTNATAKRPTDAVVTIDEEVFTQEDLEFYTFMEKIQIESGRYFDQLELDGQEAKERDAYWDDQLVFLENVNVQLNNMIEIYSMRLLAEEKSYDIHYDKVKQAMDDFNKDIEEIDTVQSLIDAYGREQFDEQMEAYMKTSLLRDRVVRDLQHKAEEEHPDAEAKELNMYLANSYEELYMDHLEDLEIQIHLE